MKIYLECPTCRLEKARNSDPKKIVKRHKAVVTDNQIYRFTCSDGHKNIVGHLESRYVVMFEVAVHAMIDGYYREAVSSFMSSLEVFYLFYIKTILEKNNIPVQEVKVYINTVENRSEVLNGAFKSVYILETKKASPNFPQKKVTLRNNIIHKGLIPSELQALKFGDAVMNVIHEVIGSMSDDCWNTAIKLVNDHVHDFPNEIGLDVKKSTQSFQNIVGLKTNLQTVMPLREYIDSVQKTRHSM